MNKLFILAFLLFLVACNKSEPIPIEKLPKPTIEPLGVEIVEKDTEGFIVDTIREVQLTEDESKEIFAIFHDDKMTYFRVYDFSEEKNEWEIVYENFGLYNEIEPYLVTLTYPPFANYKTEHLFISRQSGNNGYLSFFVIGEANGEIKDLLDNDFSEDAEPIYQGDFDFDGEHLTIYSNGSTVMRYYWSPDSQAYIQN